MNNIRQTLLASALIIGLTAALTRYYFPRVVTKTVTVEHVVEHTNVHTIVKTVVLPDGTRERVRETTDTSTATTNVSQSTESRPADAQWLITLQAIKPIDEALIMTPHLGLGLSRRIIGPVFAGVSLGMGYVGANINVEL